MKKNKHIYQSLIVEKCEEYNLSFDIRKGIMEEITPVFSRPGCYKYTRRDGSFWYEINEKAFKYKDREDKFYKKQLRDDRKYFLNIYMMSNVCVKNDEKEAVRLIWKAKLPGYKHLENYASFLFYERGSKKCYYSFLKFKKDKANEKKA